MSEDHQWHIRDDIDVNVARDFSRLLSNPGEAEFTRFIAATNFLDSALESDHVEDIEYAFGKGIVDRAEVIKIAETVAESILEATLLL